MARQQLSGLGLGDPWSALAGYRQTVVRAHVGGMLNRIVRPCQRSVESVVWRCLGQARGLLYMVHFGGEGGEDGEDEQRSREVGRRQRKAAEAVGV